MELPELTVDLDGVLCRPILWYNFVISRDVRRPPIIPVGEVPRKLPLPHRIAQTQLGQTIRYAWRSPMPGVRQGLAALAELRRLVLLSSRPEWSRAATERWLARHRLSDYFAEVVLNDRHLPNAAFKLATARKRNVREHIDDDGRVAYFLAQDKQRKVYLISWRANAGLPYPPSVQRVRGLLDVAMLLREGHGPDANGQTS